LIVSTDPAHNLSDAFCQKIGREPTPIEGFDNLSAMEIDANNDMEEMQRNLTEQGADEEQDGGLSAMMSELTNSIPGIDEAMSFSELMKQVQNLDFDVVVFDTAPTGHTLRLLSFPTILEKALGKVMELKDRFGGLIGQATAMMGGGHSPGAAQDAILGRLEETRVVINKVNDAFQDPSLTTFVSEKSDNVKSGITVWTFVQWCCALIRGVPPTHTLSYIKCIGLCMHPGISFHLRDGTFGSRIIQIRN
jgi:arsenite/tail-anchored protein-transporting ATPase